MLTPKQNLTQLKLALEGTIGTYCLNEKYPNLQLINMLRNVTLCIKGRLRDIEDKEKNLSLELLPFEESVEDLTTRSK